jgi:hypothetical protein
MKRYLISMAIRTVCVVLAVFVGGPMRWVFIAGAVFLPYIAVIMANAVGERRLQLEVMPDARRAALQATAPEPPAHIYVPETDDGFAPDPVASSTERVIPGSNERPA